MNINYADSCNFKPIPAITPLDGYWQNGTWKFNMPEITAGVASQPSWQDIILSGNTALTLTNALANGLNYLKLFGATEQRNIPSEFTQVNYVTNTAQTLLDTGIKFDFSKNYEIELRASGVTGSWYILQAREDTSAPISGISGSLTGNAIGLNFDGTYVSASQISRVSGHIYYIKGTINNGNLTLYVKDETAGTEETVTGTYTPRTGQSVNIGLFGNVAGNYVAINSDVYFARIKEDGNYIMDYVPCKQSTTAGFYDKASGTFKTTTNLSAGADAVPSPDTPMDIVSNNGAIKVSPNLFDQLLFELHFSATVSYVSYSIPNGTYTMSTNFPVVEGVANVFIFAGEVTSGASSATNGVMSVTPRTITVTDGKYTVAYRSYHATNTNNPKDFNWQLEAGSIATPYMPYGQIYTDGTVETINVHSRNLYNPATRTDGYYISASGVITEDTDFCYSDLIPVEKSTRYALSGIGFGTAAYRRIHAYDANGNWIEQLDSFYLATAEYYSRAFTIKSNTVYIRISVAKNDTNIQLEQGSTATDYKPYYNGGTATAEMLLKVGTYQDVQSVLDGGVTRKVGIKVLDGTETWSVAGSSHDGVVRNNFYMMFDDAVATGTDTIACSIASWAQTAVSSYSAPTCRISNSKNFNIVPFEDTTTIPDVASWKQFLASQYNAGTPVVVVYPISSPTTETVTAQPLTTQAGTNIVEITQSAIDNLGLEVSFKQSTI